MFCTALWLLLGSLACSLRLSGLGGSFPKPLSREEEERYLELAAQGDLEARNVLVERNLRLVAHVVKKYYTQADDQDDLISIGTIGLIKGITTFDRSKGARLATYAARCVENEILMNFRRRRKTAGDVSLSETIETGKDGSALSLMDVICSEDDLFENFSAKELRAQLREAIRRLLTERERRILILRYGLDGAEPLTQGQTAQLCGISRSYVSRIEKKAVNKLRQALHAPEP